MRNKKLLTLSVVVSFGIIAIFVMGCENIPFLNFGQKKNNLKKETAQQTVAKGTVIAKVNNMVVTLEELNQEVENINNFAISQNRPQDKIDTRDEKLAYLKNELIPRKLLYQEGLDRHLDKRDEVQKAIENVKSTLIVTELLKDEIGTGEITSEEIEKLYNEQKQYFRSPEERKILEIVTASENDANQVLIQALQGQDFAGLAKQYSKAASASKGGDLGYIQDPRYVDPKNRTKFEKFYEAAFTLEKGKPSSVFKGPDGYYVIRVEDIKESKQKSLSESWDDIKQALETVKPYQKRQELVDRLSKQAKIEVYDGKVE